MHAPTQHSPLTSAFSPVSETADLSGTSTLIMSDASCFPKLGLKGPDLHSWLDANSDGAPKNTYGHVLASNGVDMLRLGPNELYLEDRSGSNSLTAIADAVNNDESNLYVVTRQEACIVLYGQPVYELLRHVCALNFEASNEGIWMTGMAGSSVLIEREQPHALPLFRIWVEPSSGLYLWNTLREAGDDIARAVVDYDTLQGVIRTDESH